uniref:Zgc:136858 n=1 Tax=Haplochromis burtoni TaxID=8153 RepID=A0A3Q2UTT7_HAPBU
MIAAHRAGIPVFVTGGIGGVHRDGENSELSPTFFENTFYTFSYHFTKSCAWSKQNMLSGGLTSENSRYLFQFGQTNPGSVCQSFGGVGRNIADSLSRLGQETLFISATGADSNSDAVLNYCKHMNTSGVARLKEHSTATYCAVITESGELSLGLGDMDIHQQITEHYVSQFKTQLSSATLVCLDGNIPTSTINYVCCFAEKRNINVWYEPTDSEKACKPFLSNGYLRKCCPALDVYSLLGFYRALDGLVCWQRCCHVENRLVFKCQQQAIHS